MTILINNPDGINTVDVTEYNKDTLINLIGEYQFSVDFVKKDGTNRNMLGTRNLNKIPADKKPKNNKILDHKNVITAYDLNNNGWRSFDFQKVNEIIIYKKNGV